MSEILKAIKTRIWAIQPDYLDYMATSTGEVINTIVAEDMKPTIIGSTAILPLYGLITQKADIFTAMFGGTSAEIFGAYFSQLAKSPDIKTIVFDVNSPGGEVFGTSELVDKIKATKNGKKVIAVANSLMASAAYWISTTADEIVSTPSGITGSIGVIAIHEDISEMAKQAGVKFTIITSNEHKGEGNPYEPLTETAKTSMQQRVNYYDDMFVKSVSENRRISQKQLRETYGNGKTYTSADAIKLGVIDKVATLEQVITKIQQTESKKSKNKNIAASL